MTAQLPDTVLYRGTEYSLTGINGEGLFEPSDHGMRPYSERSVCERGYVAKYAVKGDRLVLEELHIKLGDEKPKLHGVAASGPSAEHDPFDTRYANIHMPVPYTGGLLIASGFCDELFVDMGFQPAWKYREVHELRFERGRLTAAMDMSEKMSEFREEMRGRPLRPPRDLPLKERAKWTDQCFSRKYTL